MASRWTLIRAVLLSAAVFVPGPLASSEGLPQQAGKAEPAPLERGVVIERVVCLAAADQSYALYLPSTYRSDRRWPILYAFDPGARGAVPVQLAKEAAERFGWIVAGSNNSQNGPREAIRTAVGAMLADTQKRFALDERRTYATGFSGGARVAASLALVCPGCLAGVIAQGAGLPVGVEADEKMAGVAWFGAAGERDFNYRELFLLDEKLSTFHVPRRLRVFDGGHEWAPAAVWMEAAEWLELLAMNAGRRGRDPAFVASVFARAMARADKLEHDGDILAAGRELSAIARDFASLPEAAAVARRSSELAASAACRRAMSLERQSFAEQDRLSAPLHADLQALSEEGSERLEAVVPAHQHASGLRERLAREKQPARRLVLERALGGVYIASMEAGLAVLRAKRGEAASVLFEVASTLRPEARWPHLQRARALASVGHKNDAIRALRRALELGFDPTALAGFVETNGELAALRGDPALGTPPPIPAAR